MNNNQNGGGFGRQRQTAFGSAPNYSSVQPDAAAQETAQPGALQWDAAPVQQPAPVVQEGAAAHLPDEDFTLSVSEIRVQLESLGISKSRDTIQRYCRDGALEWRKLGMFNRYFVTERSVKKLIEKLQLDEASSNSTQLHEASAEEKTDDVPVHAAAPDEKINTDNDLDETASSGTKVHAAGAKKEGENVQQHASELGSDAVQKELRNQIADLKGQVGFLQEELTDRRQQTKALSAVIDAFQKNAETANLMALAQEAERKSKAGKDSDTTYTAKVVD